MPPWREKCIRTASRFLSFTGTVRRPAFTNSISETSQKTNLVYFGLVPEWSGRKVGPWLLGTAVQEAFSRGARTATVNTCTLDHPAALPLYQKLGFVPTAREERRLHVPPAVPIPDRIAVG
jgi:GNAT superfamily N-acetyltransferase